MVEWIISSSVLIAVVALLRFLLKGKISLRLQYALWGLVLVRLLLPFSVGSSSISVMNSVERSTVYQSTATIVTTVQVPSDIIRDSELTVNEAEQAGQGTLHRVEGYPEDSGREHLHTYSFQDSLKNVGTRVLKVIWLCGSVLMGIWFAASNLRLAAKLRKSRIPSQMSHHKLPVYVTDAVDTPCLFGLVRPAIYLTGEAAENETVVRHAVAHELTHYRHRDHLWAILRCVCLAVHWYNPLVWCAAILSRNDAELACDESTIRRLGENERAEYGRTLLRLTCEKRTALLTTATTMTSSGKSIKERIALIVHKPKMAIYTLIAVVVIAAIAVGCTFTGAKDQPDDPDDGVDPITEDDGGTEDPGETEYNDETGDNSGREDNGETEPLDDLSFVLRRLETLKPEDIKSFGDMETDAGTLVPLINAAAKNSIDIGYYHPSLWRLALYLSENRDDQSRDYEQVFFNISTREDIVDVIYHMENKETDTSIHIHLRLKDSALYWHIRSLYITNAAIDEEALAEYGDILSERAQWRMEDHNANLVQEGFPAFTGFEIAELQLVDSFSRSGVEYLVYRWDAGFLTDDPDPGRYGWPEDAGPDAQGRIRGYDWYCYLVAAWFHDDMEYAFFDFGLYNWYQLDAHAQILERFTGEKVYLEGTSDGDQVVYTRDGVSIAIPNNLSYLTEPRVNCDGYCFGTVMNPSYYLNNPYMTDQTLFALHHICDYWESGTGWIFSIRRYTEEEYGTLYLNSYSRQSVFAKDDTYYYCVYIPTDVQFENPETAAIIEELRDQHLSDILSDMIERNGWETYTGE